MNAARLKQVAFRATTLGVLLVSTAGIAMAQNGKPDGPPVTTKGAVKSNPKADKGQATAEAARVQARENKAEKSALKNARKEPKALLKGIRFTSEEKRSVKAMEKRYDGLFRDLATADKATNRAGTPDALYISKIEALRLRKRAELRAALTPAQRIAFDNNIAILNDR